MNETTIHGNLTADPQLRFTRDGDPVVSFNVAVNRSRYDSRRGEWVNLPPVYHRVVAWRQLAENIAESLSRGMLVTVTGFFADDSWEREGQTVRAIRLDATDVSASLRFATVAVTRTTGRTPADRPADPVADAPTQPITQSESATEQHEAAVPDSADGGEAAVSAAVLSRGPSGPAEGGPSGFLALRGLERVPSHG